MNKPFAHQLKSLKHAEHEARVFDCSDPGTGKTAVRIWATAARIKKRQVKKVLVLAPKSLLRAVWKEDIKKFAPHLRAVVSTAGEHEAAFKVPAEIYITNTDAVKWLAKQSKVFFRDFDELIIDESAAYKHHTSQRSKAVAKIAQHFKYRSCLTGTPNSNSITDVWHQVKVLDDGKRLGHSFYAFRLAVCEPTQVGRSQHAVQWHDKEGAEEIVFGLINDIVVRHKFEDCVDIPANHVYTVPYELTAKQKAAYLEMETHQMMAVYGDDYRAALAKAKLSGKPLKPLDHITAVHAAAMRTKLLQIASGAIYESEDKYHVIDDSRYEMVLDLVEQRKHSVVFFLWKHQRDLMMAEAEKRGIKFSLIDGSVKDTERAQIVKAYQGGAFQTLFLHPQSAAHGLTLTRGTASIWASPTYNAEWFVQGNKRIYRLSQTKKTETITVLAEGTCEERVYNEILMSKTSRMANLLDLFSIA